jgi:hypothetical protein
MNWIELNYYYYRYSRYENRFRRYLTNRHSQVRISGILSSSFELLSGVRQGSVLRPLLLTVSTNDLCSVINHSRYLIFADGMKIYRAITFPEDCNLLQSDINSIQGWCTVNYMKLNISKTKVMSFSRKTNILIYEYKLCQSSITRTDSIEDLGVFLDYKLHFHNLVNYIYSQFIKLLDRVRCVTFSFSSLEC